MQYIQRHPEEDCEVGFHPAPLQESTATREMCEIPLSAAVNPFRLFL